MIRGTYHPCTYAHYGADPGRRSFANVVWQISEHCQDVQGWESWPIERNNGQGLLTLKLWKQGSEDKAFPPRTGARVPPPITAKILPPAEPGDQTVPVRSADHQLTSTNVKAAFRQVGYEHQNSYKDERALAATMYSIVRIALQAKGAST